MIRNALNAARTIGLILSIAIVLGAASILLNNIPRTVWTSNFFSLPVLGVLVLIYWMSQFLDMMRLSTQHFNGPYDKLIWGTLFIFLFPIAPMAFWFWKQGVTRHQD